MSRFRDVSNDNPIQVNFLKNQRGLDPHSAKVHLHRVEQAVHLNPLKRGHVSPSLLNTMGRSGSRYAKFGLWAIPGVLVLGWMVKPLPQEMKDRWGVGFL